MLGVEEVQVLDEARAMQIWKEVVTFAGYVTIRVLQIAVNVCDADVVLVVGLVKTDSSNKRGILSKDLLLVGKNNIQFSSV